MLRLIGKTLTDGQEVYFDLDEIENVFPSDGVLYVRDNIYQIPVKLESIRALPMFEDCPACDGIGSMKFLWITLHCNTCHGTGLVKES